MIAIEKIVHDSSQEEGIRPTEVQGGTGGSPGGCQDAEGGEEEVRGTWGRAPKVALASVGRNRPGRVRRLRIG